MGATGIATFFFFSRRWRVGVVMGFGITIGSVVVKGFGFMVASVDVVVAMGASVTVLAGGFVGSGGTALKPVFATAGGHSVPVVEAVPVVAMVATVALLLDPWIFLLESARVDNIVPNSSSVVLGFNFRLRSGCCSGRLVDSFCTIRSLPNLSASFVVSLSSATTAVEKCFMSSLGIPSNSRPDPNRSSHGARG